MIGRRLLHYEITARLGVGGMGEVYRAKDEKLGRDVALKVLPAELAAEPERLARLQREAQALAALDHPNIVTIYSVEEADGLHFLTMALVEGNTLGQLLETGPFEIEKFFELAIPLADALAAAHDKGVIHRDLKPDNVMVSPDGRLSVLDFGLARREVTVGNDDSTLLASPEAMTQQGQILGTMPYMSPEQVEGKTTDPRSDIFSLGIVLYEMATGRRPFAGDSAAGLFSAILKDRPAPLLEARDGLPRHLGRIVAQCLEKAPAERFQSARDVANQLRALERETAADAQPASEADSGYAARGGSLRTLLFGAAVIGLVALSALWLARGRPLDDRTRHPAATEGAVPAPTESASIAVLPLVNLSGREEGDYFSDGLTDELRGVLSKIPDLRVAARTSSSQFKDRAGDIGEIGRQLNVATVLEGSVRRAGDLVRVTAQLVNVSDGLSLWSNTYNRELVEIFAVQEEIASAVARELQVTMQLGSAAPTARPESYTAYLQARYYEQRQSEADLRRALDHYLEALDLDPEFAPAWAGLAWTYSLLADTAGFPRGETYAKARAAVEKALELDDSVAHAYAALGRVLMHHEFDWAGAEAAYRKGLELDSADTQNRGAYAVLMTYQGRPEAALEIARLGTARDPLNPQAHYPVALAAYCAGRLDEAARALERIIELNPARPSTHAFLAEVYLAQSRPEDAERVLDEEASALWLAWGRLFAAAAQGREVSDQALSEVIELIEERGAYQLAQLHSQLGRADDAFAWLERGYDERVAGVAYAKVDPLMEPVREDPRYGAFLTKLGLE